MQTSSRSFYRQWTRGSSWCPINSVRAPKATGRGYVGLLTPPSILKFVDTAQQTDAIYRQPLAVCKHEPTANCNNWLLICVCVWTVDKCNAAQNSSDNVPLILQSPLLRIMPTGSGGQKPYKAMLTDKKACTHAVSVEQAFLAVFTHFLGFKEHTHTHNRLTAICPGLPVWASTRRNIHPLTPMTKKKDSQRQLSPWGLLNPIKPAYK